MSEKPPQPESAQQEIAKQEIELSHEIIEMVMEKVEAIKKRGIAFHVLNAHAGGKSSENFSEEIVSDVLRDGILGTIPERWMREKEKSHRGAFIDDLKGGKQPLVWFEIIGRNINDSDCVRDDYADVFDDKGWMTSYSERQRASIAIIFDNSKFTDGIGKKEEYETQIQELKERGSKNPQVDYFSQHAKTGTYFPANERGLEIKPRLWNQDRHTTSVNWNCGHAIIGRVSPRHFRGIVLKVHSSGKAGTLIFPEERDPVVIENEVKKLVEKQLKVYRLHPEKLLPIYDTRGNLLWPKQLSYDEIKNEEEKKEEEK